MQLFLEMKLEGCVEKEAVKVRSWQQLLQKYCFTSHLKVILESCLLLRDELTLPLSISLLIVFLQRLFREAGLIWQSVRSPSEKQTATCLYFCFASFSVFQSEF